MTNYYKEKNVSRTDSCTGDVFSFSQERPEIFFVFKSKINFYSPRICMRLIFPLMVLGNSDTNSTIRGYL